MFRRYEHFLEKIMKVNYESAVVAVIMLIAKPLLYSAEGALRSFCSISMWLLGCFEWLLGDYLLARDKTTQSQVTVIFW